ncbi:MAG: DUF59 domain-containing protein [Chloroflexi bacterium]|nr:DUF59 domain-containing protein [Chloroflexota bacterium]
MPARLVGQPEPTRGAVDLEHGRLPDPVVKAISEAFERQSHLEEQVRELEKKLAQLAPEVVTRKPRLTLEEAELVQRVHAALREVIDPEVGLSLVDLGFVRDVAVRENQVEVRLALPESECPFMDYFSDQIRRRVMTLNGIEHVGVTFVDAQCCVTPSETS